MRESIVSTDRKKPVDTATLPVGASKVKPRIARSRETHASLWPLLAVRHYAKSFAFFLTQQHCYATIYTTSIALLQ